MIYKSYPVGISYLCHVYLMVGITGIWPLLSQNDENTLLQLTFKSILLCGLIDGYIRSESPDEAIVLFICSTSHVRSVQVCTDAITQARHISILLPKFELNNQCQSMWANVIIQWLSLFVFTRRKAVICVLSLSASLICQQGKMKCYLCWVTEFGANWQFRRITVKIQFKWSTF